MLGSVKSMTTQLGPSDRSRDRNSWADVNVSARNPTHFRRPAIDARASASSSLTNTVGDGSPSAPFLRRLSGYEKLDTITFDARGAILRRTPCVLAVGLSGRQRGLPAASARDQNVNRAPHCN